MFVGGLGADVCLIFVSHPALYQLKQCAGIVEQSMGARNRVGIGLSYRPTSVGNFSPAMGARKQVSTGLSYRPASLRSLVLNARLGSWNRFLAP